MDELWEENSLVKASGHYMCPPADWSIYIIHHVITNQYS